MGEYLDRFKRESKNIIPDDAITGLIHHHELRKVAQIYTLAKKYVDTSFVYDITRKVFAAEETHNEEALYDVSQFIDTLLEYAQDIDSHLDEDNLKTLMTGYAIIEHPDLQKYFESRMPQSVKEIILAVILKRLGREHTAEAENIIPGITEPDDKKLN
jgi:hypothetical protein